MRQIIRTLVLLPTLVLVACGGGDSDDQAPPAALGQEFVLGHGKTIDVGSLAITFSGVTEDSRCPLNATCVAFWEGNGQVRLSVTNGRTADILELNTNPRFATFDVFDGHIIQLRSLDPLPWAPARAPDTYSVTLIVTDVLPPG